MLYIHIYICVIHLLDIFRGALLPGTFLVLDSVRRGACDVSSDDSLDESSDSCMSSSNAETAVCRASSGAL